MYPQTYGTRIYGKRFPIEIEQQISASTEGFATISYTKIFLLHLVASAIGMAQFMPKVVGKKLSAVVEGTTTVRKAMSIGFSGACEVGAKITKQFSLTLSAACEAGAAIRKQVNKTLLGIAVGLASIFKHRVFEFEFIGSFEPGDVVRIDSRTLEITLNDENALHLVEGDFPMLRPGEQELIYADNEGSRKVRVKVQWRDRWI